MIAKPILPVLALLSIVHAGAASSDGRKLSSAKAFKDDEAVDAKAEKVGKASKSKAGKMFKSKFAKTKSEKAGSSKAHKDMTGSTSKGSIDYEPLNTRTDYPPAFVNEHYWHPKSSNFELMDWEKWETTCSDFFLGAGRVYDPPQRSKKPGMMLQSSDAMSWWQRSQIDFPQDWATSGKPNVGKISDGSLDIYARLLGPNPDSSLVPEALRNKLIWMQDNDASETLVSFNRGAWRSNTSEGRVVGLSAMRTDWSNSPNAWGKWMTDVTPNHVINHQVSPDGKWIKSAVIGSDPSDPESTVSWLDMYVVQEDDVFTDVDGNALTDVNPGDVVRYTFERDSAYDCDPENFNFMYFFRPVALLDEPTGKITTNSPYHERLLEFVMAQPSAELHLETHGFTDAVSMSQEERWDFQVAHPSDYQQYVSAATPPHGDAIENL